MIEVEYITLGEASDRLTTEEIRVPSPTLRHWTDQLEEYRVHYVRRNNRNERIYDSDDLKIFAYLRDQKDEHGRKTTTKDLAYLIAEKADKDGTFNLRPVEDAPLPKTNKTAELMDNEDIKRMLESSRVQQFMRIMSENIRGELQEDINAINRSIMESHEAIERELKEQRKIQQEQEERSRQRDQLMMESLKKSMESRRGLLGRLFGK